MLALESSLDRLVSFISGIIGWWIYEIRKEKVDQLCMWCWRMLARIKAGLANWLAHMDQLIETLKATLVLSEPIERNESGRGYEYRIWSFKRAMKVTMMKGVSGRQTARTSRMRRDKGRTKARLHNSDCARIEPRLHTETSLPGRRLSETTSASFYYLVPPRSKQQYTGYRQQKRDGFSFRSFRDE
jgi:hypothetical protein